MVPEPFILRANAIVHSKERVEKQAQKKINDIKRQILYVAEEYGDEEWCDYLGVSYEEKWEYIREYFVNELFVCRLEFSFGCRIRIQWGKTAEKTKRGWFSRLMGWRWL